MTKGEVLALRLAAKAGIAAAKVRLVDSDGAPVTLVQRFDRTPIGERIMYVSAATLMSIERGDENEHAYTEMVDALREHGARVREDVEELWRRMAFNILVTNVDLHAIATWRATGRKLGMSATPTARLWSWHLLDVEQLGSGFRLKMKQREGR